MIAVPVPKSPWIPVGVVGTNEVFNFRSQPSLLPIEVQDSDGGVSVTRFTVTRINMKLLGPAAAGEQLKLGDIITHVEDTATPNQAAFLRSIERDDLFPGDLIRLVFTRNGKPMAAIVPMAVDIENAIDNTTKYQFDEGLSLRRTGFRDIVSHDAIVPRELCGGPIIDTDGHIVGINIARNRRAATFAIPHVAVQKLVEEFRIQRNGS